MPKESKALGRTASLASMPPEEAKALGKTDSSSSKKASNALGPTASLAAMSPEEAKALKGGRTRKSKRMSRKSKRASFRKMFRLYGGASIAVQTLLTKLEQVAGTSVDESDDAKTSILMDTELARQAKNEIVPKLEAMKAAKESTTPSLFGKLKQGVAKLTSTGPANDTASTKEVKQMLEDLALEGNTTASPEDFQSYLNKINRAIAFAPSGGRPKKTRRYSRRR
jgi:hypothetical protein